MEGDEVQIESLACQVLAEAATTIALGPWEQNRPQQRVDFIPIMSIIISAIHSVIRCHSSTFIGRVIRTAIFPV